MSIFIDSALRVGLVTGGGTMLWLGQINLNAGQMDIMLQPFLQGMGMALLFVPLTTVSMSSIVLVLLMRRPSQGSAPAAAH